MTHSIDVHVGKRIRQLRWLLGMTQADLAQKVGIKPQQIQKYETAFNRVSASRLWDISNAMDTTVPYFFSGICDAAGKMAGDGALVHELHDKEAISLVKAYYSIPEKQRRRLFELAQVLAA